ncbi:hypothetical protein B0H10DRAFT_2429903 [Mycena sp. CBHHK59/15]|nr:hypothetical protein B0H10DRAFT_2429903 [Mycena sp. CBHHK59/15]
MKIGAIDFGTFHMYPQGWGETNTVPWGTQWITDHATTMKSSNRPVILEEFGIANSSTRPSTYSTWYQTVISTGLTGDLIWQAGSQLTNGPTSNDGFAIYPTDPVTNEAIIAMRSVFPHTRRQDALAPDACAQGYWRHFTLRNNAYRASDDTFSLLALAPRAPALSHLHAVWELIPSLMALSIPGLTIIVQPGFDTMHMLYGAPSAQYASMLTRLAASPAVYLRPPLAPDYVRYSFFDGVFPVGRAECEFADHPRGGRASGACPRTERTSGGQRMAGISMAPAGHGGHRMAM